MLLLENLSKLIIMPHKGKRKVKMLKVRELMACWVKVPCFLKKRVAASGLDSFNICRFINLSSFLWNAKV
jgi:hypothetical protein